MTSSQLEQNRAGAPSFFGRIAGALTVVVTVFFLIGWVGSYALIEGPQTAQKTVTVEIFKGASIRQINQILGEAGLVYPDPRLYILAKLSGLSGRLQAGEFSLKTNQRPLEVIKDLASAHPIERFVTIREGLRASDIAKLFETNGYCDAKRYEELVRDKALIQKLGFEGLSSLEGYLFPDTYRLTSKHKDAEQLISLQVRHFIEVAKELGLGQMSQGDRHRIVILASMVEKETGAASERPIVAAVFINRLAKGMKLQSDPTVVYGIKDFSGAITKTDLQTPTEYNTYTLPGLPVGPIANPGRESLAAVMHPAETKYLYFVSKNDGTHQFSENLADHNAAVQTYQVKNREKVAK